MWKTFRKIRRVNDKSQKYGFQDAKYKKYALYSWGCPLIVTVVTITMQHLPNELVPEWLTTPDIGTEKCFLRSTGEGLDLPQLWYFHVINAPLLLMNMVFFLLFLYNMCCGVWSQKAGEPGNARTQRKLKAVCKVFFVMGISSSSFFLQFVCINFFCPGLTWIAEIISYSLKVSYGHHVYVSQFTFPLQLLNALQVFKKSPLLVLTYILLKKFCVAGCHYVLRHLFHPRPGQEFEERTMVVQQD